MKLQFFQMASERKKTQGKKCEDHQFIFTPVSNDCYYKKAVTVQFCLNYGKSRKSRSKEVQNCYEGPVFNQDKNHMMAAFVLNSQKKKYLRLAKRSSAESPYRYQNYTDEKSHIIQPKPNFEKTTCHVCKERYVDYLQHINTESHRQNLSKSPFNNDIHDMAEKYRVYRGKEKEVIPTSNEASNLIVIDDDEELIGQYPTKKVKKSLEVIKQEPMMPENGLNWQNYNSGFLPPPPQIDHNFLNRMPCFFPQPPFFPNAPAINFNFNYNFLFTQLQQGKRMNQELQKKFNP